MIAIVAIGLIFAATRELIVDLGWGEDIRRAELCAALAAEHPERATAMEPFLALPKPRDEAEYREVTVELHDGRVVTEVAV